MLGRTGKGQKIKGEAYRTKKREAKKREAFGWGKWSLQKERAYMNTKNL